MADRFFKLEYRQLKFGGNYKYLNAKINQFSSHYVFITIYVWTKFK